MTKNGLRQLVWDLPTRLFHWLLVGLIGFSWWSAETRHMDWHQLSGQGVLGLLVFRVLWGVFGSSTARFRQFARGPRGVWSYLRGRTSEGIGHNPLGGWSVLALLITLGAQVISGLLAVDVDGIESGPLSYLVDFEQGRLAAATHAVSFNILLGLIGLHLAAIVFYLVVRRRNLTGPMITGFRRVQTSATALTVPRPWRLVLAIAAGVLLSWWVSKGAGPL